jgi:hypothetical protein
VTALGSLLLVVALAKPGTLVENVATRADATQTYTLYLPTSYDEAKSQPVLLVMDPRGRGTQAAEIFRGAAEEFGWVVLSSNQTRSDGPNDPNERAVRALFPETALYRPSRIYAAGFSGTAILAWSVGIATGRMAGVIGVGGRLDPAVPPEKFNFAHYGFAGERDFNQREMRLLDARLRVPHRFTSFDGAHEWIPPALARQALGWMEAVAGNRREDVLARDLAAARALQGLAALRQYAAIARTYGAIPSVDAEIARLQADPSVQRELRDEARWDEFEEQYVSAVFARMPSIFAKIRAQEAPPTTADFVREFRVRDLRRRSGRAGAEGAAARRLLEAVYAQAAFYLPRQLADRGESALAEAVRGVAEVIHPGRLAPRSQ